jgi:hypothetical protein
MIVLLSIGGYLYLHSDAMGLLIVLVLCFSDVWNSLALSQMGQVLTYHKFETPPKKVYVHFHLCI